MASRSAQTKKTPEQFTLVDGELLVCSCGSREFRVIEEPFHLFCRCGKIYTSNDFLQSEE